MDKKTDDKQEYIFGGIKEFDLEKIEAEVLNESMYLEVFAGSDMRFKKNIRPLDNPLAKLLNLKGVTFDWRVDEFADKGFSDKEQIGFLAQDVLKEFHQLVKEDCDGHLAVNYSKMVPVLIEGMREMSQTIEEQGRLLNSLLEKNKMGVM